MIVKKTLAWISAGLLSAAIAIPAIGTTLAKKSAKHAVVQRTHVVHHKASAKTVAHRATAKKAVKGKTVAHKKVASKAAQKKAVLASHAAHRTAAKHVVNASHKVTAAHKVNAVKASYGVTSMHSGKTNATAKVAGKKNVVLAKSTTFKSKSASKAAPHGTVLSASKTIKLK